MEICELCNTAFSKNDDHLSICSKLIIECDKCKSYLERGQYLNHINNSCEEEIVKCPYVTTGCNKEVKRRDLSYHLDSDLKLHHMLTLKEIGLLKEKNAYAENELSKVNESMKQIQEEINKIATNLKYYNTEILKEVSESKNEYRDKIHSHYSNLTASVKTFNDSIERNKEIVKNLYSVINK